MKNNKMFYGWWIVVGGAIFLGISVSISVALAGLFSTPVTMDTGISVGEFTLANALLQAVGIFLSPIASKYLAGKHFNKIHLSATIVYAACLAFYGLSQTTRQYYLVSILMGICFVFITIIPVSMMVTNWFEKKRGLALSISMAGLGVGGAILSPVITSLIGSIGWRYTYVAYGALIFIVCVPISLFIFKLKPSDMGLLPYGAKNPEVKQAELDASDDTVLQPTNLTAQQSFTKPFFWLLIAGMLINGILNSSSLGQFPRAFTLLHNADTAALMITTYSLVGIVGKLVLGRVNDQLGLRTAIIYGTGLFGLVFVLMLFAQNIIIAFITAIVFGFGNAIGTVLPPLIVSGIYSSENYGEAYGFSQSAYQLGMTFGSLAVASTFDIFGTYSYAWVTLSILSIVTIGLWLASIKGSRKYTTV